MRHKWFAVLSALATLAAARAASAQACKDLIPPPLYLSGSTALEPLLKSVGPKIAALATNPYTIVYLKDGSCSGADRIVNKSGLITQNMFYLPPGYDPTATPTPPTCTVDAVTGVTGDLVIADTVPTLCPQVPTLPATIADYTGPVNAMVFITPPTATQQAISYEEAYLVFGKGAAGQVSPWLDPMYYFIRPVDSGTRALVTANIGHPIGQAWQGVDKDPVTMKNFGSGDVLKNVQLQAGTANVDKTIGILGADVYDSGSPSNRSTVKALAFRAKDQKKAFWPDSTPTAFDRKNVRDGHYNVWGYVHMLANVSGSTITNPKAQFFIDLLQGNLNPAPAFDVDDAVRKGHLVPICAMHVKRSAEGANQSVYQSPTPCDCWFDSAVLGSAAPGCTACSASTPCASGQCRHGYCEAR